METILLVVGDGGEVMDTMVPMYRLREDYDVVVAGPKPRVYHLVQHELEPGWDITVERPAYRIEAQTAFRDVDPDQFAGLVLPGGRAPEYLRYDQDLMRIVKRFFQQDKPTASICHGIEILAAADVIRGRQVTTIPKCRYDAEFSGGTYVNQPVVVDGRLVCCQGKKDLAPWMKAFVAVVEAYVARAGQAPKAV
ncbi:MAG: peptidase [Planctomycetota bacterium]|nr:MAG: peptidase [Planctomycetota bacterium]